MSEPQYKRNKPPVYEQQRILNEQGYQCFWCERQFESHCQRYGKLVKIRIAWDHVTPFIWSADSSTENFVASCQFCNGWKADRIFQSIEEVKVYVAEKWEHARQAKRQVRELSAVYQTESIVAEVLQPQVQVGILGVATQKSSN